MFVLSNFSVMFRFLLYLCSLTFARCYRCPAVRERTLTLPQDRFVRATIMSERTLTRRALLLTTALSVFFINRFGVTEEFTGVRQAVQHVGRRLTSVLKRKRSARTVGKEYLRRAPEEADRLLLVNAICGSDCELQRALLDGDDGRLRIAVRNRLRRDFADGRTVLLDGWLLSRTEARLCALATIV